MSRDFDSTIAHQLESWCDGYLRATRAERCDDPLNDDSDVSFAAHMKRVTACARLMERVWGNTGYDNAETMARGASRTASHNSLGIPDSTRPSSFGRFEIRRELGRGGFGIVFLAFDPDVRREVALKLPRSGILASPDLKERFQREASAAGRLDHPNLIPVYESGQIGAIHYLTCAYCPGPSLSQWQRDRDDAVPAMTVAGIVAQLAEAVQHAHSRGVLHRDLKPSNVLLQPLDETSPSDTGIADFAFLPRVSDFGLARDRNAGEMTHTGELLGTASFMSPEQAASERDLDERTDVYALGAILYQLMTGQPPFSGDEFLQTLQRVRSEEPTPPRVLRSGTPRDLDAICLKCLEKQRSRRYATASELAADLQRFLSGQPTKARPVSASGRLLRWARRYPAASGLIAVLTIIAVAVPTALIAYNGKLRSFGTEQAMLNTQLGQLNQELTGSLKETRRARDEAESNRNSMRRQLYIADLQSAKRAWDEGDVRQYKRLIAEYADAANDDIRGIEWHALAGLGAVPSRLLKFNDELFTARFAPGGEQIAVAGRNGIVYLVQTSSLSVVNQIETGQGAIRSLDFSPDGTELATGGMSGIVQTWNLSTQTPSRTLYDAGTDGSTHVAFSRDGLAVAAAGPDPVLRIWNRETGHLQWTGSGTHQWEMECLALSPDRNWLATTSSDGVATLFSTARPEQQFPMLPWGGQRLTSIDFSHDTAFAAAGTFGRRISVWDIGQVAQGKPQPRHRFELVGHVSAVRFRPHSYELAIGDRGGDLYLWNMADHLPEDDKTVLRRWSGHNGRIYALDFSSDGSQLLSASADGVLAVWTRLNRQPKRQILSGEADLSPRQQHFFDMAVLVDQPLVATAHSDAIRLWNLDSGQLQSTLKSDVDGWDCVGASPDGSRLAAATESGDIVLWDTQSLTETAHWKVECDGVTVLNFNHDSSLLAVIDYASTKHGLQVFDIRSGKRLDFNPSPECNAAAFSPDGSLLAVDLVDDVQLWDMTTMQLVRTLPAHDTTVNCIAFHPDGHLMATCSNDRTIRLWNVDTGERLHTLEGHRDNVNWIEFSPDGRTILSAGEDSRLLAWQVATGKMALELHSALDQNYMRRVGVSAAGRHLVVRTTASRVLILDAIVAE